MLTDASTDDELIEEWLIGKASSTREEYRRDWEQFVEWAGTFDLEDVTPVVMEKWKEELESRHASSTATRKINALKSLLSYADKTDYLNHNVGSMVQPEPVSDRFQEHVLPPGDVEKLIEGAETFRNRVLLLTLYGLGVRSSEATDLQWCDCLYDQRVKIRSSKRGFDRVLPVPDGIWKDWDRLRGDVPDDSSDAPIFQKSTGGKLSTHRVWEITKEALRTSPLDEEQVDVSPHWLRHCHATHALNNGAPLSLIRLRLGHQSIETTKKYLHGEDGPSGDYLDVLEQYYGNKDTKDAVREMVRGLAEDGAEQGEVVEIVQRAFEEIEGG